MTEATKNHEGTGRSDTFWVWVVATLTALGTLGGFFYGLAKDGMPTSVWPIVLVDAFFVILLSAFVVSFDRVRVALGWRPWLHGAVPALLMAMIPFAVAAGVFAGHASTQQDPPTAAGSRIYANELRREIQKLRRTAGAAVLADALTPKKYAQEAETLSAAYSEVSSDLRAFDVNGRSRPAHRRLVNRLAVLGAAYDHLAEVVIKRSSNDTEIDSARDRVEAAMNRVRAAEQGLERLGIRIAFS